MVFRQNLKQYYQSLNRDLWVLDITSDLNIPCFAAISSKKDREVEDIVLGYGAHFDPKIAIGRALTEVNQILPNISEKWLFFSFYCFNQSNISLTLSCTASANSGTGSTTSTFSNSCTDLSAP